MRKTVVQGAALAAAVVVLVAVLALVGLNPSPVRVSLIAVLAWIALAILSRLAGVDRRPWPRGVGASAVASTDERFTTYLHLLEDNERSKTPGTTLADRLAALAEARTPDDNSGSRVAVPRASRLSRRQIAEALDRIEER